VVLGTTDTPLNHAELVPRALDEEVNFILEQAGEYLDKKPTRADVLSVFAGLRPLAAQNHDDGKKTKEISRSHKIYRSKSGLLTITGGKWTTYREMAEEAVNIAAEIGNLTPKDCITKTLKVHGYAEKNGDTSWNYVYGSDASKIAALVKEDPDNAVLLHPKYSFTVAHVVWAVRQEQAQSVEDVLARRVRALFLDAKAAIEMAPKVATVMAKEMNKPKEWIEAQVSDFTALAKGYLLV
jgi:glycerol-3-phosphate dehydrogenase